MRNRILLVSWVLLLSAGQAIGADPVTVVDSNGVVLGPNTDDDGEMQVPFKVGSREVLVSVTTAGFEHDDIYFASADCSGTRFLDWGGGDDFYAESVVSAPGDTLYIRDYSKAVRVRDIQSRRGEDDNCVPYVASRAVAVAKSIVNLRTLYTPPFKIVLGPSVQSLP